MRGTDGRRILDSDDEGIGSIRPEEAAPLSPTTRASAASGLKKLRDWIRRRGHRQHPA